MCVTSSTAYLNNTVVGGWDIQHPTFGYRHVLAYQNAPKNLALGANCMLLHIPTTADLVPSDLVDTSACPKLLYDIVKTLKPLPAENTRSIGISPQNHIIEMGVYHVALLNDLSIIAFEAVLNQIPVSKRPTIAPALLAFYIEQFPNYRLVLACFDNRSLKTASAIMLHYEPMFPRKIFFPLLEGHDGNVPRIGQNIRRHQQIIYGSMSQFDSTFIPLSIPQVPEALIPFLPKYVGYNTYEGAILPNNDVWFVLDAHNYSDTSSLSYWSNWRNFVTKSLNVLRQYFRKKDIIKERLIGIDADDVILQDAYNHENLNYNESSEILEEMGLDIPIELTLLDKSIIRELISNGNTEKVLLQLQNAGYPQATIAYDEYQEKAMLLQRGSLESREWNALQKQLYEEILTWEYLEETKPQSLLTEAEKLHIRQLLNSHLTAEALTLCKKLGDKPAILSGYYTRIMKGRILNLLTESEQKAYIVEINGVIKEWLS